MNHYQLALAGERFWNTSQGIREGHETKRTPKARRARKEQAARELISASWHLFTVLAFY
jgi:hypothetical protein